MNQGVINKAGVWLAVSYPENMLEDWEGQAEEILQGLPFAYCVHDKDKNGHKGDRKHHVHWMIDFRGVGRGTTTRKHALEVVNLLSKEGAVCCPGVEACLNAQYAYDYLIHDTEKARKDGKFQYSPEERKESATFDIERLVKISEERKQEMAKEICDWVIDRNFLDMRNFYIEFSMKWDEEYFLIFKANNAMIERLVRGNYNAAERKKTVLTSPECGICGSRKILGSYETPSGRMWYCEECQEYAYRYLEELEEESKVEAD